MSAPDQKPLRIGYSTLHDDWTAPGDRRRFCYYAARRGLPIEIARPEQRYDVVVSNVVGDLSEWVRLPRSTKFVLDMVDSYLAVPRTDPRWLLRGAAKFLFRHTRHLHLDFRALIEASCRRADAVICATEEQRQQILGYCPNVHVILDFHTAAVRTVKTAYSRGEVFNLVWEGFPGNLVTFDGVAPVLKRINARRPLAIHLVTALEWAMGSTHIWMRSTKKLADRIFGTDRVFLYEWNEEMVSSICTSCDLAIIPIPLEIPLFAGKSENKLLFFWRMGVPALTSASPAYARTMKDAGIEMTCQTAEEWQRVLERYMDDEAARREAGQRGMAYVNRAYGEENMLRKWDQVFASMVGS